MIIKKDQETIQAYFDDASGLVGGHADRIVIPETEDEIAAYLKDASKRGIPVTVSGGGTGVTGGRIAFGGDVLSLESFTRISGFKQLSPALAAVTAQAGVTIRDLKAAALQKGWMYAPDPTEQTSSLGGNIATNASGARGFKYGSTRRYIRRLKVILATGEALEIERGACPADPQGRLSLSLPSRTLVINLPAYRLPSIKNAAGYYNLTGMDLIDLFIGHEGTLGIVTEAEVSLIPAGQKALGGIAFFSRKERAWEFVREVKKISLAAREAGGVLEAMALEYFDRFALDLLRSDYPNVPEFAEAAVFFEQAIDGRNEDTVLDSWAALFERFGVRAESVWFSNAAKEQKAFREFRHRLPEKVNEIVRRNGFPKTGTDLAVPDAAFDEMMRFYADTFAASGIPHLLFGHIGESHMHANLLPRSEKEYAESKRVYLELARKALSLGGTVSAEHGIGKLKHAFIEAMLGKDAMTEMARLKKTLDPAGILGRGNLFPDSFLD